MSTGNVTLHAPGASSFDLEVDGSTGNLVIDVADRTGVQVEVRGSGLGSLHVGDEFTKVRQGENDDEGVWQNEAYATTTAPIRIVLEIGTGNVDIR